MSSGETVLEEADRLTSVERQDDYDHPYEYSCRVAAMWNIQLGPKLKEPITPRDSNLMMVGAKLCREVNKPKRDNLVDISGYARCAEMVEEREEQLEREEQRNGLSKKQAGTGSGWGGEESTRSADAERCPGGIPICECGGSLHPWPL